MAFSKSNLLLLGLAFAVVLLISSEISAARELQRPETTQTKETANYFGDHHGFHHGHGHGHHGGHGHGHRHGHHGVHGHRHHGGHHGHRHRHHGGHGHRHHGGHHGHSAAETQEVENEAGEN